MNCPDCNQSYAADTFACLCGCKVHKGERVDEIPGEKINLTQAFLLSRLVKVAFVLFGLLAVGVVMIQLKEVLYGLLLVGVGVGLFGLVVWDTRRRW